MLALIFSQPFSRAQTRNYDRGVPTPEGIERFILENEERLAEEYMDFVQDTLYYYNICTDEITAHSENEYEAFELGRYYFPGDIIISNENKYIDYAVDSLSFLKRNLLISNKFVKGCVFHELTHIWLNQILTEMGNKASEEYRNFRIYYHPERDYGADFIEEGICEFIAHKAGEITYQKKYVPDLDNDWNTYEIKYQYSEYYIRQVLDKFDNIKEGINLIFSISPPNEEEIRNPELYYQRVFSKGTRTIAPKAKESGER